MDHISKDSSSILSTSKQKRSGSFLAPKNIRAQMNTSNFIAGSPFKARPPFSVQKNLVGEPVRNRLLRYRVAAEKFAKLLRKRGLAAANLNCAPEGCDVCFLHEHRLYTSTLVLVNQQPCMTGDKAPCSVLIMRAAKKQPPASQLKRERASPIAVGPDGKTMGQRLKEAMDDKAAILGAYAEADLVLECNHLAGREKDEPEFVKQQLINQILNGEMDGSRSSFVSLIAEAVDVRPVWLQYGFGTKRDDRSLARSVVELVKQHSSHR